MRRVRKSSNPKRGGTSKDACLSTSSEEEDIGVKTRSSLGKRKANKDSKASVWDSMYDGDEDTATSDLISPQKISDPYEFDFTKDVPANTRSKSKTKKQTTKVPSQKETKKSASMRSGKAKSKATSTPVLTEQVSGNFQAKKSRKRKEMLVTPEVTPILPVQIVDKKKESSEDSYNTPTVRRSLRKRSLHLDKSDLSLKNSSKSFSSQADSGIVVSPPLKKMRSSDSFLPALSQKDEPCPSSSYNKEPNQSCVVKKDVFTYDITSDLNKQNKRKVLVQKLGNEAFKRHKRDDSCFGFDSSAFSSLSDENFSEKKTKKSSRSSSKQSYRSMKKTSCSSSDSPVKDTSSCMDQENIHKVRKSPILFSDDTSSDDGADKVSKPSKTKNKSYTALKAKTQKSQKLLEKLDTWADEFNSQFADIEKFELVIE